MSARFALGQVVATPAALEHLNRYPAMMGTLLARHQSGDWGEVCEEDAQENDLSVGEGFRILSAYTVGGEKLWVITEADRSSTCVLFPSEY